MTQWTATPPTVPGWYWFYGRKSGSDKTDLAAVRVFLARSAKPGNPLVPCYVIDGSFVFPEREDYVGVYTSMMLPELPR